MCCVCKDPIYIQSKVTESVCVNTNDMQEAITECTEKCNEMGCGCVAVSANDPGDAAHLDAEFGHYDAECPKARCALAMDPATYTVGSWGNINYDGKGYISFNNNAN